jgi:predicted acylesterase/phospholipase RssA
VIARFFLVFCTSILLHQMSQSVSLVLSSGGARGYAHVGVIEALERNGFSVSSVTGSSMGAVVGGIYAAGGLEHFKNGHAHWKEQMFLSSMILCFPVRD